jgi:hypothetical protein
MAAGPKGRRIVYNVVSELMRAHHLLFGSYCRERQENGLTMVVDCMHMILFYVCMD